LVKCSQCEKEYKNNAGLVSHMRLEHGLNLDGTPADKAELAKQKQTNKTNQAKAIQARRAKRTQSEASQLGYKVQIIKGPFTCPECSRFAHKRVEFATARDLGKHRRFKHQVMGKSSTAAKSRELTQAKREALAAPAPVQEAPQPKAVPAAQFQCPTCPRSFDTERGLNRHKAAMHNGNSKDRELTIVNGKDKSTSDLTTTANGSTDTIDFAHTTAQALIAAYAAGQCKGLIASIADRHDISARQLTIRCAQSLLSEARR
jgi:hypothetical protein